MRQAEQNQRKKETAQAAFRTYEGMQSFLNLQQKEIETGAALESRITEITDAFDRIHTQNYINGAREVDVMFRPDNDPKQTARMMMDGQSLEVIVGPSEALQGNSVSLRYYKGPKGNCSHYYVSLKTPPKPMSEETRSFYRGMARRGEKMRKYGLYSMIASLASITLLRRFGALLALGCFFTWGAGKFMEDIGMEMLRRSKEGEVHTKKLEEYEVFGVKDERDRIAVPVLLRMDSYAEQGLAAYISQRNGELDSVKKAMRPAQA